MRKAIFPCLKGKCRWDPESALAMQERNGLTNPTALSGGKHVPECCGALLATRLPFGPWEAMLFHIDEVSSFSLSLPFFCDLYKWLPFPIGKTTTHCLPRLECPLRVQCGQTQTQLLFRQQANGAHLGSKRKGFDRLRSLVGWGTFCFRESFACSKKRGRSGARQTLEGRPKEDV